MQRGKNYLRTERDAAARRQRYVIARNLDASVEMADRARTSQAVFRRLVEEAGMNPDDFGALALRYGQYKPGQGPRGASK